MPRSRGTDPPAGEQIPEQSDDPGFAPGGRGGVTIGKIARSEMDLAGLRAFLSLARVLHFGATAAELGISQPALSQQISRLERRLGVQLFRRDSRNVALTEAGVVLANQAGGLLAHAERVISSTVAAHRGQRTVLVVGFLGQAAGEATGQTQMWAIWRATLGQTVQQHLREVYRKVAPGFDLDRESDPDPHRSGDPQWS